MITPRVLMLDLEAAAEREKREHHKLKWHTYMGARLARAAEFPDFEVFMGIEQNVQSADEQDSIFARWAVELEQRGQK